MKQVRCTLEFTYGPEEYPPDTDFAKVFVGDINNLDNDGDLEKYIDVEFVEKVELPDRNWNLL